MCTFFSRNGQLSGIITFPETDITAKGKPWEKVISTLKTWCENSHSPSIDNKDDATGIIIRNYDLEDHLDFCNVTDHEVLLKYSKDKHKFNEYAQRFLVFNPKEKIILVIRMVDSQQSGELKNQAHFCMDEVNVVSLLLRDELKDSGVMVTGLVTYSGEIAHSPNDCSICNNFIVSRKIFNSVKEINTFLKRFVQSENLAKLLERRPNDDTEKVFQAVGSKILGYLAHFQFKSNKHIEAVLPITENCSSGNIKQAELLLNRYQMEIAYSDEKRMLLHGNYGTGKTIVALKKLDLLYKCLKEKEVIYYIISAGKSRLDCMIEQKYKAYENVRVLRCGASLSNIITNEILPKEDKNDTKNIHLIVDEYNSQDLSPEESTKLYKLFTEAEQFKNSTLLVALQPIKIEREDHFFVQGKKQKRVQKKHIFGQLTTIMKEYKLNYVMRTTIEINTLAKITQDFLSQKSNRYIHWHPSDKISSSHSKMKKVKAPAVSFSSSIASGASSTSAASQFSSPEKIETDESYKITAKQVQKVVKKQPTTVIKYSYTSDSEIGHNIKGPLPLLIEFEKPYRYTKLMVLIAFFLTKVINIKSKRIAIIHFESLNAPWLQQLLQLENYFKGLTMTDNVEEFLARETDKMVLVNNYNTVKGLEFCEYVLLILEKDEYYLKQYIPEAIARCKSNLLILIRPPLRGKKKQSNTVEDLVKDWKEKSNAKISKGKNPILEMRTLGFCSDKMCKYLKEERSNCSEDPENPSFYRLHAHTKWCKGLSKEIKQKIPCPKLVDKITKEEATSL